MAEHDSFLGPCACGTEDVGGGLQWALVDFMLGGMAIGTVLDVFAITSDDYGK